MRRRALAVAVVSVTLAACQVTQKADADPADYNLNQAFVLAGGQQADIRGEPLRLRFADVLEDSRCPTQVECFWTGQARVVLAVQQGENTATAAEFNTNPAPGQTRQTAAVGPYTITLQRLDPYPQTPDDSPALEDYRATLIVDRASSHLIGDDGQGLGEAFQLLGHGVDVRRGPKDGPSHLERGALHFRAGGDDPVLGEQQRPHLLRVGALQGRQRGDRGRLVEAFDDAPRP